VLDRCTTDHACKPLAYPDRAVVRIFVGFPAFEKPMQRAAKHQLPFPSLLNQVRCALFAGANSKLITSKRFRKYPR
jgi:hypothetical protein